jgi:hypothetical protein
MQNGPLYMLKHNVLSREGGLLGGLALLNLVIFGLTDPVNSVPIVVILGFLVLSFDLYLVVRLVVWFLGLFIARVQTHRRRLIVSFTAFLVVCLGLGSIGQLTWRDLLVVVVVATVAYFYSLYFRIRAKQ